MRVHHGGFNRVWLISACLLIVLAAGCTQAAESCPSPSPVDLSIAEDYSANDELPFQFPLVDPAIFISQQPVATEFASYGMTTRGPEYHAAEDILQPAGTPVYAIADGWVSFSGTMGGYGWLVIIDHPQANLYTLYGHLSPSRWQIETGPVQKGELLGYLGDSDENGGSAENPMRPHLHLGVRAGQRGDYPGLGQGRWQAGWIKPCPQDLGWLQPSLIITGQDIQAGEIGEPTAGWVAIWWTEVAFAGAYIFGGICVLIYALKQRKPLLLLGVAAVFLLIGWTLAGKGAKMGTVMFAMAVLFAATGIYRFIRQSRMKQQDLAG